MTNLPSGTRSKARDRRAEGYACTLRRAQRLSDSRPGQWRWRQEAVHVGDLSVVALALSGFS